MPLRVSNHRRFASAVAVSVALGVLLVTMLSSRSGGKSVGLASEGGSTTSWGLTASTVDQFSPTSSPLSTTVLANRTTTVHADRTTTPPKGKTASATPTTQGYCGTWGYSYPSSNPNYPNGQISVDLGGSTALTGHPVVFEMTYNPPASGPATADPRVTTTSNGAQIFTARLSVNASGNGGSFIIHARAKDAPIVCTSPALPARYNGPPTTTPPWTEPPTTQPPGTTTTTAN